MTTTAHRHERVGEEIAHEINAMLAGRFARMDANHDRVLTADERHAMRGPSAPDGARVAPIVGGLSLQGSLEPATLWRFAATLAFALLVDVDGQTIVRLDSPGGNLDAALAIARVLDFAGRFTTISTSHSARARTTMR